jgi:hypothetical protein
MFWSTPMFGSKQGTWARTVDANRAPTKRLVRSVGMEVEGKGKASRLER